MPTGAFVMVDALGYKVMSQRNKEKLREKMHELHRSYTGWLTELRAQLKDGGYDVSPEISFLSDTIAIGVPLLPPKQKEESDDVIAGQTISLPS